ncbi:MAG: hypothetical protein ABI763_05355 [Bacteroidota bacterium]
MSQFLPIIHDHWQHNFDTQYSTSDFYSKIEEVVKKRNIPDVKMKRITLSESKFMLSTRDYLRISRKQNTFDVCAATFGSIFFVSYWYGEEANEMRDAIHRIRFIGPIIENLSAMKTYYQVDTQNMFGGCIRDCIMEVVDDISKVKGLRTLSPEERRPEKGR